MGRPFLAHSQTERSPEGQSLTEHLEAVSVLCASFCRPFGAEEDGRAAGSFHDIGKYSAAFQRRLLGDTRKADHSTAGAYELFLRKAPCAAMCVAGHHGGLQNIGTRFDMSGSFLARMMRAKKGELEDYSAWAHEVAQNVSPEQPLPSLETYFYVKMLFSALTDADWLDTEAYYSGRPYVEQSTDLTALWRKLDHYIERWWGAEEELNRRRCEILREAIEADAKAPGLFTMTVPTGGGKTVSSMAFALRHALAHGMRRIIYVIPYCSILDQTYKVFAEIFGEENITAHYGGVEFDYPEDGNDRRAFSAENWEAPIILTTAVQFFESIYSNRPGKCRKLHNISGSVIIFDEAQMLPVPFMEPCLTAICQLAEHYRCSAVLCTATQPAVRPLLGRIAPGLPLRELCPRPEEMYQAFRRVGYLDEGELSDEELTDRLRESDQVLCIVNSRRQAQELFRMLGGEEGNYHLSTMMIPRDRKEALEQIRQRLKDGRPCRVISTSLIEAGVDVDFPKVYRAIAGLDQIVQAGGRCNREGKRQREDSLVHIFRTGKRVPQMLEQNIDAAARVLRQPVQPDAPEAIEHYFSYLFDLKGREQLDKEQILRDVRAGNFETVARNFRLIDGADYTIYVPVEEGAVLTDRLRNAGPDRALLRALGPWSVTVYSHQYSQLLFSGAIEQVGEQAGILRDLSLYSRETGLSLGEAEQGSALFY